MQSYDTSDKGNNREKDKDVQSIEIDAVAVNETNEDKPDKVNMKESSEFDDSDIEDETDDETEIIYQNYGRDQKVIWKLLEKNVPTYKPITRKCTLCLRKKFFIVLRQD